MPESTDFTQKLRKLRNACDHAIDILKAGDQKRKIDSASSKGARSLSCRTAAKTKRFATDDDRYFRRLAAAR
jgi:hypothetical protein